MKSRSITRYLPILLVIALALSFAFVLAMSPAASAAASDVEFTTTGSDAHPYAQEMVLTVDEVADTYYLKVTAGDAYDFYTETPLQFELGSDVMSSFEWDIYADEECLLPAGEEVKALVAVDLAECESGTLQVANWLSESPDTFGKYVIIFHTGAKDTSDPSYETLAVVYFVLYDPVGDGCPVRIFDDFSFSFCDYTIGDFTEAFFNDTYTDNALAVKGTGDLTVELWILDGDKKHLLEDSYDGTEHSEGPYVESYLMSDKEQWLVVLRWDGGEKGYEVTVNKIRIEADYTGKLNVDWGSVDLADPTVGTRFADMIGILWHVMQGDDEIYVGETIDAAFPAGNYKIWAELTGDEDVLDHFELVLWDDGNTLREDAPGPFIIKKRNIPYTVWQTSEFDATIPYYSDPAFLTGCLKVPTTISDVIPTDVDCRLAWYYMEDEEEYEFTSITEPGEYHIYPKLAGEDAGNFEVTGFMLDDASFNAENSVTVTVTTAEIDPVFKVGESAITSGTFTVGEDYDVAPYTLYYTPDGINVTVSGGDLEIVGWADTYADAKEGKWVTELLGPQLGSYYAIVRSASGYCDSTKGLRVQVCSREFKIIGESVAYYNGGTVIPNYDFTVLTLNPDETSESFHYTKEELFEADPNDEGYKVGSAVGESNLRYALKVKEGWAAYASINDGASWSYSIEQGVPSIVFTQTEPWYYREEITDWKAKFSIDIVTNDIEGDEASLVDVNWSVNGTEYYTFSALYPSAGEIPDAGETLYVKVRASGSASMNYKAIDKIFEITIAKAPVYIRTDYTVTYDGEWHSPEDYKIYVYKPDDESFLWAEIVHDTIQGISWYGCFETEREKNAGTYPLYALLPGNDKIRANYEIVIDEGATFTITPQALDIHISPNDVEITYGDAALTQAEYSYTVTGEDVGELDKLDFTGIRYLCEYKQWDDADNYDITLSGITSQNYTFTLRPGTLTVKKKDISDLEDEEIVVVINDGNPYVYNGDSHGAEYTISYRGKEVTYASTIRSYASNAGTHEDTVEGTGNYTGERTIAWTIEKRVLEINFTGEKVSKVYGDAEWGAYIEDAAAHNYYVSVLGLQGSDTVDDVISYIALYNEEDERVAFGAGLQEFFSDMPAGVYHWGMVSHALTNYAIHNVEHKTESSAHYTFGEKGIVEVLRRSLESSFAGLSDIEYGEEYGKKEIEKGITLTGWANDYDKTRFMENSGMIQYYYADATGAEDPSELDESDWESGLPCERVGEYFIRITIGVGVYESYYEPIVHYERVTIEPKELEVAFGELTDVTYGGDPFVEPTLGGEVNGYTVEGLVDIDDGAKIQETRRLTYTKKGETSGSSAVPTEVGEYVVTLEFEVDNYLPVHVEASFTIRKATLTAVSVAQEGTLTYNGRAQAAAVKALATAVNGNNVTFTYATSEAGEYGALPTFKNAGSYIVYYKATADRHETASGHFTVTIAKKAITVTAEDKESACGAALKDLTFVGEIEAGDVVCTASTAADKATAGEYDIVLTSTNNPNYEVSLVNGKYVVKEAEDPEESSEGDTPTQPEQGGETPAEPAEKPIVLPEKAEGETPTVTEPIDESVVSNEGVDVTNVIAQFLAAVKSAGADDVDLCFEIGEEKASSVTFDLAALKALAEKKGGEIKLIYKETRKEDIDQTNSAIKGAEFVIEVSLVGGTFEGGKATITATFEDNSPAGQKAVLYYVAEDGSRERVDATFEDGKLTFTTTHFSTYVVGYVLTGGSIAGIVIASVVFVGVAGFLIFWFVIKKKTFRDLIAIFKKDKA